MESRAVGRAAAVLVVALLVVGSIVWWTRRDAPRQAVPVSSPAVRAPNGVRIIVEVINATSTRGLARKATFVLRDAGFDVVRYTSDSSRRDSTLVVARSGHRDWAEAVAKTLGGARVEEKPDSLRYLDVSVFLGANWRPPAQPLYP
jgi:hypothetical protein